MHEKSLVAETAANALLDFSQHLLRGHALRQHRLTLAEVVAQVHRSVSREVQEANVNLRIASAPPVALPLPTVSLVLPLVNLLLNAAKHHFRQDNRRVELRFDLEEGTSNWLVIDVCDNGAGIDKNTLRTLGQVGYSQGQVLEKNYGIGYWISRHVITEAGGSLQPHHNFRGLGASFRIRLPLHLG